MEEVTVVAQTPLSARVRVKSEVSWLDGAVGQVLSRVGNRAVVLMDEPLGEAYELLEDQLEPAPESVETDAPIAEGSEVRIAGYSRDGLDLDGLRGLVWEMRLDSESIVVRIADSLHLVKLSQLKKVTA